MLIDTNILVEIGRKQEHSETCRQFLNAINLGMISEDIHITRFTLNATEALISEEDEELMRKILLLIHLEKIKIADNKIEDDLVILSITRDLGLDYDDACQFLTTHQLATYLVTYDKDFNKTSLPTKTPGEILKALA